MKKAIWLALVLWLAVSSVAYATPDRVQEMLVLINQEREANGVEPLTLDADVCKAAEAHANDMIEKGYIGHRWFVSGEKGGPTLRQRLLAVGVKTDHRASENIAGCASHTQAHDLLMQSDGHRGNMLREEWKKVGIAVVEGGSYGMMIVQVFVK